MQEADDVYCIELTPTEIVTLTLHDIATSIVQHMWAHTYPSKV